MTFFRDDKTHLRSTCKVELGFTHPTSGDEFITMYEGTVNKVRFRQGTAKLTLFDKFKALTERVVGSTDSGGAVVMSDSTLLPSDVAWTLCTCYGGLSNIQSDSNPDIEWSSFQAWAAVFSGDSVYVGARYEGRKVIDALKRLGLMSDSAIFIEHAQLEFNRFSAIDSANVTVLTDDENVDVEAVIDDANIVNKQHVYGLYDVDSGHWAIDVVDQSSTSVDSFGVRENILKDESVWYVNSASAINMAQRQTSNRATPFDSYSIAGTLVPLIRTLGETIKLVDPFLNVSSVQAWRIMEYEIDLDKLSTKMSVDGSQVGFPFILDDAYYGLLDQSYNKLL